MDVKLKDFLNVFVLFVRLFFYFLFDVYLKNCLRILKLANKNYLNLYLTWCFHTYCRSFWPQPVMQNLNLLRPNFAHLHKKFHLLVLFEDNWNSLILPPVVVVGKQLRNLKLLHSELGNAWGRLWDSELIDTQENLTVLRRFVHF